MNLTSSVQNRTPAVRPRAGVLFQRHGDDCGTTEQLTLEAFSQLAGILGGHSFVKVVVDRLEKAIHFIDNHQYEFHADFIAEMILGTPRESMEQDIDTFNHSLYLDPKRRFYLGILALHERQGKHLFSLETVEVDNMDLDMIHNFYRWVREHLDGQYELYFKPSNHGQEHELANVDRSLLPHITNHELFEMADFVALNDGESKGRLRVFRSQDDYRNALPSLGWSDIIVMERVPDDIPRVAGIINAGHTTPLSHTNVLAHGWHIPNAIQLDIFNLIAKEDLAEKWVTYRVDRTQEAVQLRALPDEDIPAQPNWTAQDVQLEAPEVDRTPIRNLNELRMGDAHRFGTKAANLGELHHVLQHNSNRLLGFYRIPRPPRPNLLNHLRKILDVPQDSDLQQEAWRMLQDTVAVPRGISIPFSFQQEFLNQSPQIQQMIGKLKMALELNAREINPLCVTLQRMIRSQRMSDRLRDYIDAQVVRHLAGTSSFVVRSSSNAEDLENFSAAGIYESLNHVTTAEYLFQSIKDVWASLLSHRSVRLRHSVNIPLDDSYMGVIIQEEVQSDLGGVLVTTNPMERQSDFRNVFVNATLNSTTSVVNNTERPYQILYNTVEGGGRTLSFGSAKEDLSDHHKSMLQRLAFVGRLLQSHFSKDYTFASPLDIEWAISGDKLYILQIRPYAV